MVVVMIVSHQDFHQENVSIAKAFQRNLRKPENQKEHYDDIDKKPVYRIYPDTAGCLWWRQ